MSKNSVAGQVAHAATHISDTGQALGTAYHAATHLSDWSDMIFGKQKASPLQDAGSPEQAGATTAQTTQGALEAQVGREGMMKYSQTQLSSYTGLLDDTSQPSSASRVLLGGN